MVVRRAPATKRSRVVRALLFRAAAIGIALLAIEGVLQIASLFVTRSREVAVEDVTGDALRILCVGDSNTFGAFVAPDLSYPAQLERLLRSQMERPVHVINVGQPGRNSAMMLRDLPDQLERHRPDILLLLGGVNNTWNAMAGEHWGRPGRFDALDRALLRLRTYKLMRLVSAARRPLPEGPDVLPDEAVELDRAFLYRVAVDDASQMIGLAKAAGVRTIVQSYFQSSVQFPLYSAALEQAASIHGVPFVDHVATFQRAVALYGVETIYFKDAHLKAPGYRIVASNLASALLDRERPPIETYVPGFLAEQAGRLATRESFDSPIPKSATAIDLYNRFADARTHAVDSVEPTAEQIVRFVGNWRFGLHLPVGSRIEYDDLMIPEASYLVFRPAAADADGIGVRIRVELRDRSGAVAPIRHVEEVRAFEQSEVAQLDLSALGGRRVDLVLTSERATARGPEPTAVLLEPVVSTIPWRVAEGVAPAR